MNILAWIILGGLAGWIGSMIARTDKSQGFFMNIIVGIVGAFVGGLLFSLLGGSGITGFNLYSLAVAIFGSILFLGVARALSR